MYLPKESTILKRLTLLANSLSSILDFSIKGASPNSF